MCEVDFPYHDPFYPLAPFLPSSWLNFAAYETFPRLVSPFFHLPSRFTDIQIWNMHHFADLFQLEPMSFNSYVSLLAAGGLFQRLVNVFFFNITQLMGIQSPTYTFVQVF